VDRRGKAYNITPSPHPAQWPKLKLEKWLMENPIPSTAEDLEYIQLTMQELVSKIFLSSRKY